MAAPAWTPESVERIVRGGFVSSVAGLIAEVRGLDAAIGAMAEIETGDGFLPAEVVGFRGECVQIMPLGPTRGVEPGCRVWPRAQAATIPAGDFLLGRVLDSLGRPIDAGPRFPSGHGVPLHRPGIPALERPLLGTPLDVGVTAMNGLATLACGQRIGLFAGAGVGKSTLLGMMIRGTSADVVVIGLVGERGREVREFVDREVGPARHRTVVVAEPADSAPLLRMRGAYAATAIAESFRARGKSVLLMMDSLTRFAMAAREVGLARGEPAATKGYTPSVFAELPNLLERAGRTAHGSITGVYTVLVEGDDLDDPIADSLRALLDGHVVLSRELAERGHFPAIDVLASVSRAMEQVTTPQHRAAAQKLRRLLAAHRNAEDLIQVGAYASGSDPDIDLAIARKSQIEAYLRQDQYTRTTLADAQTGLAAALEGALA